MATVLEILQKGTGYLEKYGIEDARLNMQHLLAHILKCNRMQVYVDFDRELTEHQLLMLRDLTKRRSSGEPLQHLLGTSDFCGLQFKTDHRALIPRQETEELTDRCAKLALPEKPDILDLGCGSGVIGLSLGHLLKKIGPKIVLADLSEAALALAGENRSALLPAGNVSLIQSDLFGQVTGSFDLIVANLPYIPNKSETTLSREVRRDPPMALFGGETGTEIIERFFQNVNSFLKPDGRIALEYGFDQENAVRAFAEAAGFIDIKAVKDLGGISRFLFAVKG
jgi:release factor glutamine methyltransferase